VNKITKHSIVLQSIEIILKGLNCLTQLLIVYKALNCLANLWKLLFLLHLH